MYRDSAHSKLSVLFLFIFLNLNLISSAQSNYNVYNNYSPDYLQKEVGSPDHLNDFENDNSLSRDRNKLQAYDKDLQVDPTFQKTFYINYRPPPPRRRRLLPYFILGFAAGSAGILGGAAAAGALRG
ncbi:unnamed protein product [Orchesella dallaii]|uniref:Secreted protein n=1 Tax=Orchesella dallaii TaxID=48710 RepID=A0ABP1RCE9_9HEXA